MSTPLQRSAHPEAAAACGRIDAGRPLARVAAEGGVSRTALTKWYQRWLAHGDSGLLDRTSRPDHQPTRTPDDIEEMVIQLRAAEKWGPDRIAGFLPMIGAGSIRRSPATVWRILDRHGLSRLPDLDMPTGESERDPNRYQHRQPGDLIHVDVKKVGRIPDGAAGPSMGAEALRREPPAGPRTGDPGTSTSTPPWTTIASWPTPKSRPTSVLALPARSGSVRCCSSASTASRPSAGV
jgi:hypothetical protein